MNPIRILVDSFADADALNAQMANSRDIMSRLDPARFHVTTFCVGKPDARLLQRPSTSLIQLPRRRQTIRILRELVWGRHRILFYVKPSPAERIYLGLPEVFRKGKIAIGSVESQSDLRSEPTVKPEQVRMWERTVLKSDFLTANSHSVQASLKREYGLESEVVSTGVDTKFFQPASSTSVNARPRILFVGALRPFKGPQVVLRAAARFPAADFLIVGDGVLADELKRDGNGLKNLAFVRALDAAALREEYRRSDIFLFPSRWEGSPKVILEAASCAVPVIARRDYQPESVVHEQTGLLGSSDEEVLEHLATLLAAPDLRRKMGVAGRAHVAQFDWDIVTRRWEDIFERLARGNEA